MDETGERRLLGLDGTLIGEVDSVGYFGFLPNLGSVGWFLKKLPAAHAFSILGADGVESPWLAFEEILIDPCPPKPGEEVDDSNPFEEVPEDPESQEGGTDETETDEPDAGTDDDNPGSDSSGGCNGANPSPWIALLLLSGLRRSSRLYWTKNRLFSVVF